MTQEEKRIKLAEAQGWKKCHAPGLKGLLAGIAPTEHQSRNQPLPYEIDSKNVWHEVPDYFNDLNACHELYFSLKLVHQIQFLSCLFEIVRSRCAHNLGEDYIWMVCVNASSEERCNAFGRALSLWKEGE